jgi:hypothetical protein
MQQSSRLRSNASTNHQWRVLRNGVRKLIMATHEILSGSARSGLGCGSEVRAETNLLINKGVEESD